MPISLGLLIFFALLLFGYWELRSRWVDGMGLHTWFFAYLILFGVLFIAGSNEQMNVPGRVLSVVLLLALCVGSTVVLFKRASKKYKGGEA
ncbi:hypothetical protein V8J88_16915 [Massilia sp. W12]|uniref:hypothetical protein n=1 Tax=Massilia sp. W12 TaxID=3126507 RepID=UPI0030D5EA26